MAGDCKDRKDDPRLIRMEERISEMSKDIIDFKKDYMEYKEGEIDTHNDLRSEFIETITDCKENIRAEIIILRNGIMPLLENRKWWKTAWKKLADLQNTAFSIIKWPAIFGIFITGYEIMKKSLKTLWDWFIS